MGAEETTALAGRQLELATRWHMLVTDVRRFANESTYSADNSKRWYRANNALEQLATRLVDNELMSAHEEAELERVLNGIWRQIKSDLLLWAERTEAARAGDTLSAIQGYQTWPEMVTD